MPAKLVFAEEAEGDVADAYAWYEGQRAGLGEDFLLRVDACIEGILRYPDVHPVVHESYRRALVRRFPYAIFYEHDAGTVRVYAILHTARDPAKWRRRLPR